MEYFNALLGGMGLFLVGMWLMTDGLKLAAGDALRSILNNWTKTPVRGLVTGFFITALVQSSSAITVATIGFANAGLISFQQAIWVIFGSNVGTTMTGWIVSMIGFKINLEAYALPLIGIGMIVRMAGGKAKRTAIGQTILGFGLFFLGISVLKEAFMGLGASVHLPAMVGGGLHMLLIYLLIGFVLTTLMQSSSAAIVVILSAAEGGLVPLGAAAATVIGANLGTTTTALFSVLGAVPTAKRVAATHILFNLITASIAIIIITPMLWLVAWLQSLFDMTPSMAVTLAIFHTVFNILGVILMWPLSKRLVNFLQSKFVSTEEIKGKPKYLDSSVLTIQAVAADALFKELINLNKVGVDFATATLSQEISVKGELEKDTAIIISLTTEIGKYIAGLNKQDLSEEIAQSLPQMILISQQYISLMDLAKDIVDLQMKINISDEEQEVSIGMNKIRSQAVQILKDTIYDETNNRDELLTREFNEIERKYEDFKVTVFKAGSKGKLGIVTVDALVGQANLIKRMAKLGIKITRRMHKIAILLSSGKSDTSVEKRQ